ncbi:hypothetical protein GCK32_001481 [Trichostrongylus colubriformis]|uniref:Uncharacterized protein n=1 Tax=Trichostrongylus colubriformis TaxID=6319 RepID=A0AAN8FAH9_TRICO
MKQVIQLFLAVFFQAAVCTQKASSPLVQCSDYLRCRSDDLEMRWKCIAEQLSVFSESCRTERHVRSLKALTMRRESDFADCVATITPKVEDNEMQAMVYLTSFCRYQVVRTKVKA